ncbi:MAG: SDR family NAD(P)-dependent oxidoreductase [Halobaculum sp.]
MTETVLIAGVGEQLGTGLARAFAGVSEATAGGETASDGTGSEVALLARSSDYVEQLASDIRAAVAVTGDVTDPESVTRAVEAVEDAFGPVDVLIHNASAPGGDLADPDSFATPVSVRVEGAGNLVSEVLPGMRERESGTILFSGTTFATDGSGRLPGWAAAAAGTRGLARSLAERAGEDGVHVCYVALGGSIPPADARFEPANAMDAEQIGETFVELANQPETAWTSEIDLRPSHLPP